MLLNVKNIINAPGERMEFRFDLDLSDVDFGGLYPAQDPVVVTGEVRNIAGMLLPVVAAVVYMLTYMSRSLSTTRGSAHGW